MTLWDLDVNAQAYITGTLPTNEETRLKSLGFITEQKVLCLQKTLFGGPKVYQIGDNIFSLSKEVASTVLIDTKDNIK